MGSVSNFQTALEGVLVTQISAAATTATVKVKEINGVVPTWLTTAHRITIIQKSRTVTKVEVVDVAAGTTQSGSTVTLGTMTRGLPLDGTGFTGTGTPQVFTSGARVIITWDAQAGRQTAFKDATNTFTGVGAIRSSSTSTPVIRLNNVTTAQKNAMSAANGDMVYDTDLNQFYKYEAGAWAAVDTGTFSNAADGTGGKVDLATAAEVAAGTATDASSSAPNVIPVSIVKTSSTGAVNGTVPALNASVALDRTIGGLGTTSGTAYTLLANGTTTTAATQSLASVGSAGQVLTSAGAGALPTFANPDAQNLYTTTADSGNNDTGTWAGFDQTYDIAASSLSAGDVIEIIAVQSNNGGTRDMRLRLDTGVVWTITNIGTTLSILKTTLTITDAGATGAGRYILEHQKNGASPVVEVGTFSSVDFTQAVTVDFQAQQTAGSETTHILKSFRIIKYANP